ncbi:hypothetical protein EMIHUDRAFT_223363 [Emiliania huxleyi CCMP1516]|uniref:tRNA/rRNA methyltransferase SpoU type domain-containing protein n=2 Tax=Emiliania huxleyi TaxID=2903 RepID=A0A0D3KVN2_EMIH1|nr:hypothetical protein EMIHUDRAFT_223363 [Emiliania huxleyi CCMP1516]EOD39817.1 hypothetical protein EMIHUDRAFT_223363 [Emiliania huxleyi CCMP1516]|eukprot:XP_005792246.1 hypothetical protein EMIHUDRAFT_223363 [Emiliania huxleyi CCMP1516]
MPVLHPDDGPESPTGPGEVPQRLRRAELVLSHRCGDILLVLDRVCDKHNIQAVMRTAEALGVQNLWTVAPEYFKNLAASEVYVPPADAPKDLPPHAQIVGQLHIFMKERELGLPSYTVNNMAPRGFGDMWRVTCTLPDGTTVVGRGDKTKKTAMRYAAEEAMKLVNPEYKPPHECLNAMKQEGWTIWATAFSPTALKLSNTLPAAELPQKLAIVIGGEALGVSDEILTGCDRQVFLPMYGFTESLNLSVATAMILQRLFDLKYCGSASTERGALSAKEKNDIRTKWWDHLAANPTARARLDDFTDQFHSAELAPLTDVRDHREDDRKHFAELVTKKYWRPDGAAGTGSEAAFGNAVPLTGMFVAGALTALVLQRVLLESMRE